MKRIFFAMLVIAFVWRAQGQTPVLTVEKIMQDSKWIGTSPGDPFWSPDSHTIYFRWNPEKNKTDSSYYFTLGNKAPVKANYIDAQKAVAMHRGTYNNAHTRLAYPYRGDIFLFSLADNTTRRVTQTADEETDPGFSNQDKWITFHNGNNLYAWDIADGTTKQLTLFISRDSPVAEKKNQEEQWLSNEQLRTSEIMKERKNKREAQSAYLQTAKGSDTLRKIYIGKKSVEDLQISPDARFITYSLAEEPTDAKSTIVPQYVTESGFTTDINGRTKVGAPQVKTKLYIFDRVRDSVISVSTNEIPGITDLPDYVKDYPAKFANVKPIPREIYVNHLYWNEDGSFAIVDIFSLDNKDRWLMQLDPSSGKLSLLDRQHDDAWIEGPGIFNMSIGWINNHTFYFQSESTGYSHLYSYDMNMHSKKAITHGSYEVQDVVLSRDKKHFYLITNEDHPGKQHFYRIGTDGAGKEKITTMDGGYEVMISPDEKYIAYRYSYQNKPWELYIQENAAGKTTTQITNKAMSEEWKSYPWRDTKIFTFIARDGKSVYARIYEPAQGKKNNAAVIFVHGAGYLQNVDYAWSYYYHEFMFNNLLADKGYTVMDIDYRASAGYGRDWRTAIYRHMGGKDLDDEVDAARFLVKQYGIDSTRIGIYGGSYGGFMTLMAMFTQPDLFRAGAALRPVTDWAHYNHGYTSAILNEPFTDSLAYERSSPINFAGGLKNYLLICHGMVDENVHFQDAVRLTQRLIELGKNNWELAVYPVEDHGFVEPSSWTDEYKRILKLFDEYLK